MRAQLGGFSVHSIASFTYHIKTVLLVISYQLEIIKITAVTFSSVRVKKAIISEIWSPVIESFGYLDFVTSYKMGDVGDWMSDSAFFDANLLNSTAQTQTEINDDVTGFNDIVTIHTHLTSVSEQPRQNAKLIYI